MWSAQYNVTCYLANHRLVSQRCHINFSGLNQIYWDKYTKPNLQNRIYKIKSTRQNVQNVENQIYWTEYTQLNLFNQTFFKSAQLILPNQIYRKLKQSTIPAWDLLGPACSIFRSVGISRSANFTHRQTDKLILSFFMTVYAFTFAMYDYIWLFMTMYDYVWLNMTMYDYVWLYMTIYDHVWLCMTMFDREWWLHPPPSSVNKA